MDDEYEIIPTSPLRRLEKRINQVEKTSISSETHKLIEQITELIKSNQKLTDEVIKSNSELKDDISKIPGKIDELISSMHEFMEAIKESAAKDNSADISSAMQPLVGKVSEMVDLNRKSIEVGQATLASLGIIDKRLKRIYIQFANANAYR
jgi:methyl-accepting chemotaxis protein